MPRTGQKVTVVVVGGGVESKFSVQLRPKLNNIFDMEKCCRDECCLDTYHHEIFLMWTNATSITSARMGLLPDNPAGLASSELI